MFVITVKHHKEIPPSVVRFCPSQCIGYSVSKFQGKKYRRYLIDISFQSIGDNVSTILDTSILTRHSDIRLRPGIVMPLC